MHEVELAVRERQAVQHVAPHVPVARRLPRLAGHQVEAHHQRRLERVAHLERPLAGAAADVEDADRAVHRRQVVGAQRLPDGVVLDIQPVHLAGVAREQVVLAVRRRLVPDRRGDLGVAGQAELPIYEAQLVRRADQRAEHVETAVDRRRRTIAASEVHRVLEDGAPRGVGAARQHPGRGPDRRRSEEPREVLDVRPVGLHRVVVAVGPEPVEELAGTGERAAVDLVLDHLHGFLRPPGWRPPPATQVCIISSG